MTPIGEGSFTSNDLQLEIIDPLRNPNWDRILENFPDHSIFHRAAWAKVLAGSYGHRPQFIHLKKNSGSLGIVPLMEVRSWIKGRRGVSLPFSDFAGVLLNDESAVEAVYRAFQELAQRERWKYIEVRGGSKPDGFQESSTYFEHTLELSGGIEQLNRGMADSVGRSIRKARQNKVGISIGDDRKAVEIFYQLHCETRKRHGLPPQPELFFENLRKHLLEPGHGCVVMGHYLNKPVAASVYLHTDRHAVYKYGASDPAYWPLRTNHLVMWTAIRSLVEKGIRTLSFGRTCPDDEGLNRFKRSWGARQANLPYYRYEVKSRAWTAVKSSDDAGLRGLLFSRLPLCANIFAGKILYPHLD